MIPQHHNRLVGNQAEQRVADYLIAKGYAILATNYRKSYGEIDIIARKKDLIIFTEVKYRKNAGFDYTQLITQSKQKKIILVAKEYLAHHIKDLVSAQFDVVIVEGTEIQHIANAFQANE